MNEDESLKAWSWCLYPAGWVLWALTLKVHAVHSLMAASMLALDQTVLIDVDRLIHNVLFYCYEWLHCVDANLQYPG